MHEDEPHIKLPGSAAPPPALPHLRKLSWWRSLAQPQRFMAVSAKILPILTAIMLSMLVIGLYFSWLCPEDYQQGSMVKMMFLHVPFAWLAMLCYTIMACSACGVLLWKHPMAGIALKSAAPLGAVFSLLALFTGSVWGKPAWGTWWEWGDSRMFSMFILLLLYFGIIALSHALGDTRRSAAAAAILTLIGFIDIPVIKFSVEWWSSLHQPASLLRKGGIAIAPAILTPLLIMAAAFTLLFFIFLLIAMRNTVLRAAIRAEQHKAAWQQVSNSEREFGL